MADREKVIRGLESCVYNQRLMKCESCPYHTDKARCLTTLMRDALATLQEQEARVMTLEEIKRLEVLDVLWLQITGEYEGSVYSAFPVVIYMIGKHHVDFWGRCGRDFSFYNHRVNGWRLWTSRPTPEQMRETKWEES